MIDAVLWDFGGVITSSPFEAFGRFEAENNLPKDLIRSINSTNPDTNAWAKLESSQVSVEEFDSLFAEEASARGFEVRGQQVLELLSGDIRDEMVHALKLTGAVYKTACLTNNVRSGEGPGMARDHKKANAVADVMSLFNLVIESSKVGMRKPEPGIYTLACDQLEVDPDRVVFLDDLGINLKPARQMGMKTIKVLNADQALDELETHLNMNLRA